MKLLSAVTLAACAVLHAASGHAMDQAGDRAEDLARDLIVHAGLLIDGTEGPARTQVSIEIQGERISAVTPGFVTRPGAKIIDLSHSTVLPGFIDCHDHLANAGDRRPLNRFLLTDGDAVVNAVVNARLEIETGFTTVRDLGSTTLAAPAVNRGIQAGKIIGPRIWTALEPIGPSGGHSDPENGVRPDVSFANRSYTVADGAEAVIASVREHHKRGARVIKIYPSGGVASIGDDPQAMTMTVAEMTAAVEAAHALGMKVAAHAHGTKAIDAAIVAGVDSIEHGTYATAASYQLMKQHGTFLVPTLLVADVIYQQAVHSPETLPPTVADKAKAVVPVMMENFKRAYRSGVKLAFGSDQGASTGHNKAREYELMVRAGVTPRDAILAGSLHAAQLIGATQDIGSIQAGRYADLVAVTGNPLEHIEILQQVQFVMKGGEVLKADGKMLR